MNYRQFEVLSSTFFGRAFDGVASTSMLTSLNTPRRLPPFQRALEEGGRLSCREVEARTEWLGTLIALIAVSCLLWWLDNVEPLSGWFDG